MQGQTLISNGSENERPGISKPDKNQTDIVSGVSVLDIDMAWNGYKTISISNPKYEQEPPPPEPKLSDMKPLILLYLASFSAITAMTIFLLIFLKSYSIILPISIIIASGLVVSFLVRQSKLKRENVKILGEYETKLEKYNIENSKIQEIQAGENETFQKSFKTKLESAIKGYKFISETYQSALMAAHDILLTRILYEFLRIPINEILYYESNLTDIQAPEVPIVNKTTIMPYPLSRSVPCAFFYVFPKMLITVPSFESSKSVVEKKEIIEGILSSIKSSPVKVDIRATTINIIEKGMGNTQFIMPEDSISNNKLFFQEMLNVELIEQNGKIEGLENIIKITMRDGRIIYITGSHKLFDAINKNLNSSKSITVSTSNN